MTCHENLEWTDRWGVVQTDTHEWQEQESAEPNVQILVCKLCGNISTGFAPEENNLISKEQGEV